MKKIVSLVLTALIIIGACCLLSGCDKSKLTIKDFKIISQDVTTKIGSISTERHHQLTTDCKVNEDIPAVTERYIFSKDGNAYYYEEESEDFSKGTTRALIQYLSLPTYTELTYKNVDPSGKPLTVKEGDILDTLGEGTMVTVELYENGEKIAEKSKEYKK